MADEQTGTVVPEGYDDALNFVSYIRFRNGTLLEILASTPNEPMRFGRKKWIHVVRVVKK